MSSVEGKGGVRGDTWMGDLWFAERMANVSKKNRQPKLISARIFISLSIPMCVQLVKYVRWLVTDFPSLTILGPVHSQTNWQLISHAFSKIQTSKYFGAVGFVSKLDMNR